MYSRWIPNAGGGSTDSMLYGSASSTVASGDDGSVAGMVGVGAVVGEFVAAMVGVLGGPASLMASGGLNSVGVETTAVAGDICIRPIKAAAPTLISTPA